MSGYRNIGFLFLVLMPALWAGCTECNSLAPTRYYSRFTMDAMPVPESDWRFTINMYEEACPESALKGSYSMQLLSVFRDGLVIPGQTRSPFPDFPLFGQDFDVESVSIEALDGDFRSNRVPAYPTSRFTLNLPDTSPNRQTSVYVEEPESGCFVLTPGQPIDSIIDEATVQFPECESNDTDQIYAVMGTGENARILTTDVLNTLYDNNLGVQTTFDFGDLKIPRSIRQIQIRFTVRIVDHFTSEVTKILPVDATVSREDGSYVES